MKTYEFSIVLNVPEISDEDCDSLYQAGCDDGTVVTRKGGTYVAFDREAASLEGAIRTAVANVKAAGFGVARIEMHEDDVLS